MTITFATFIFVFLFLFRPLQKNTFFILYTLTMIGGAYLIETYWGLHAKPFQKAAIMLFVLCHIFLINLYTFLAYGKDKRAAQRKLWRIPEVQLHALELLGGTIGAYAGQKIFHHKNKKKTFMATYYAAIVIQICLVIYISKVFGLF